MKSPGRDLYDSSSVLSNWENEGGARASVTETVSRYASDDILCSFGQSVVGHWNELPHGFKQAVFREIVSKFKEPDPGMKERAARFLHDDSSQLLKRERRPAWIGRGTSQVDPSEKESGILNDFDTKEKYDPS